MTNNIYTNAFRKRVLEQGVSAQKAYTTSLDRKVLLKDLETAAPDWFKPEDLWLKFPGVAKSIYVEGLHSKAGITSSPHQHTP